MELDSILEPASCVTGLQAKDKDSVLHILAGLAVKSGRLAEKDPEMVYRALAEREAQGSTAFGNQVALPHAHLADVEGFLLYIAVFPRGAPFDALDRKKVRIFFVILGPPGQVSEHLRILAAVSRMLGHTNVRQEILAAKAPEAVVEVFLRHAGAPARRRTSGRERRWKLLVVSLYVEDFIYEVLEMFLEQGIEGATILDSTGMGRYISTVPLFAEFIGFMNERMNFSKTILALVLEDQVEDVVERIERITGDLDKRQGAVILVLDVSLVKGTMKMM